MILEQPPEPDSGCTENMKYSERVVTYDLPPRDQNGCAMQTGKEFPRWNLQALSCRNRTRYQANSGTFLLLPGGAYINPGPCDEREVARSRRRRVSRTVSP